MEDIYEKLIELVSLKKKEVELSEKLVAALDKVCDVEDEMCPDCKDDAVLLHQSSLYKENKEIFLECAGFLLDCHEHALQKDIYKVVFDKAAPEDFGMTSKYRAEMLEIFSFVAAYLYTQVDKELNKN